MFDSDFDELIRAVSLARWSLTVSLGLLLVGATLAFVRGRSGNVLTRTAALVALVTSPIASAASVPALRSAISRADRAGMRAFGIQDEATAKRLHAAHEQMLRAAAAEVNESSLRVFVGTRCSVTFGQDRRMSRNPTPATWLRAGLICIAAVAAGLALGRCLPTTASSLAVGASAAALMLSMAAGLGWQSHEISRLASASNMLDAFDKLEASGWK
jgi:hypothetical protein